MFVHNFKSIDIHVRVIYFCFSRLFNVEHPSPDYGCHYPEPLTVYPPCSSPPPVYETAVATQRERQSALATKSERQLALVTQIENQSALVTTSEKQLKITEI